MLEGFEGVIRKTDPRKEPSTLLKLETKQAEYSEQAAQWLMGFCSRKN